jgi:hypothetical protein
MVKRVAAAVFWFIAITWGYNYLGYYLGMPFLGGPVIAAAVSLFAGLDPLHVVWPTVVKKASSEPGSQEPTSTRVLNPT